MTPLDAVILVVGFIAILLGAEVFTNGVEWLGKRLGLGEGATGSGLAGIGTAMPETVVPVVAIVLTNTAKGDEIGVGAILCAPLMLATPRQMVICPIGYFH